jgi:hypothetical protein
MHAGARGHRRAAARPRHARVRAGRRARHARRPRPRVRTSEHELAGVSARLKSLEELDAARAEYGDGARLVLAESNDDVGQMGSVADYLEVDSRVRACRRGLPRRPAAARRRPTHDHAAAGLRFARSARRSRRLPRRRVRVRPQTPPSPSTAWCAWPTSSRSRVRPPTPSVPRSRARGSRRTTSGQGGGRRTTAPVATLDGDVFRGAKIVEGGARAEARGILTTKREIKELRERAEERTRRRRAPARRTSAARRVVAAAESAILSLQGNSTGRKRPSSASSCRSTAARGRPGRINRKQEQIATERRSAEEQSRAAGAPGRGARVDHPDRGGAAGRRRAAERRAAQAVRGPRRRCRRRGSARPRPRRRTRRSSSAPAAWQVDIQRLEEAAASSRPASRAARRPGAQPGPPGGGLGESITAAENAARRRRSAFDELREQVRVADEQSQELRTEFERRKLVIREARVALEASAIEVALRGRAGHRRVRPVAPRGLVRRDRPGDARRGDRGGRQLERDGLLASPKAVDDAPEAAEVEDDVRPRPPRSRAMPRLKRPRRSSPRTLTPDEMVADLRAKIEKMGPVNMMAIDQFDDLEQRHTFLTAQRKDLVDSIAATGEAIKKIDKTTRRSASARRSPRSTTNFEGTFTTLFGGGAPGSSCSTRATSSRAASTSSRSRPASGSRTSSCSRAARRR